MDFIRRKKERVRYAAREKYELSGRHTKDLAVYVDVELTAQNVEHLMFSRVHVRRRFGSAPHFAHNEVKRSVVVGGASHLADENALVPGRVVQRGRSLVRRE